MGDTGGKLADGGEAGMLRQFQGAAEAERDHGGQVREQFQMLVLVGVGLAGGEHEHPGNGAVGGHRQEDGIAPVALRQHFQEAVAAVERGHLPDVGDVQRLAAVEALLQQRVVPGKPQDAELFRPAVAVGPL